MRPPPLLLVVLLVLACTTSALLPPSSMPALRSRAAAPARPARAPPASPPTPGSRSPSALSAFFLPPPSPSLASSSLLFLSFNALGFLISACTGSHLHLDLLGTGAFLPATLLPLLSLPVRSLPLSAVSSQLTLSLWSLRLSLFLFYRATILRHDARLTGTMSTLPGMLGFWLLSALWGIFCSLPHTLSLHPLAGAAASRKVAPPGTFAAAVSAAGFGVSLLGLALEVAADLQKWAFKNSNPPAGAFISTGVWSYSAHPNYAGNILIFAGLLLQNLPTLRAWRLPLALLSPLFICALLYAQATGAVPGALAVAYEAAVGRYGAPYVEYLKTVPSIFPGVPF